MRAYHDKFKSTYSPEITIGIVIGLFIVGVILIEKGRGEYDESEEIQDSEEA